tara:strand:+ start:5837 stop:6190 length:354 start_codon:yes stop_codon:yes gene_type:complete
MANQIDEKKFKQEQEALIKHIEPKLGEIRDMVVRTVPPSYENERFIMELLRVGVFQGYVQGAMAGLMSYGDFGKETLTEIETYRESLRQLLRPLLRRMADDECQSQAKDSPQEDSSS